MRQIYILSLFIFYHTLNAWTITSDLELIQIDPVGYSWQSVSFENSYSSAPIVVCSYNLPSSSDSPAVVRIDQLTSSSFSIKIQKPIDDSAVTSSSVQCLVAKEGSHTLPDGYEFEAKRVLSTDTSGTHADGWSGTGESVTLTGNYGSTPAVLGQVMSYNDSRFSTFWTYNCSDRKVPPTSSICVGKHIGETGRELVEPRATETLGYIVIDGDNDGDGDADPEDSIMVPGGFWGMRRKQIYYRVELGGDTIDGVDNSGNSYDISKSYGDDYTVGVATLNAMDGVNGGWAVYYGDTPFTSLSLSLAIDEDELGVSYSNEPERSHTNEQVAYWIFSEDLGYSEIEIRNLGSISSSWSSISFNNSYTTPVVVCTYNLPSNTDNEAVVRLRNVGSTSMEIRLQNPGDNSTVTSSDVHCIIIEEGSYTFDGRNVEAYRVASDQTNKNTDWSSSLMENVGYDQTYSIPVVLGQVMSYNDPKFSAFWTSNGNAGNPPDSSFLFVGKHIGEEPIYYRENETLGFIIGSPSDGTANNVFYAIAQGANSIRGVGDSPAYSYSFSSLPHTTYSYGVATQSAENGGNGGWTTLYGSTPISTQINLAIDEETAAGDTTRKHTNEQVSYWVFDPYPNITITKTSCVIRDGVSSSANAKRITGATIRHMFEVNNSGYRVADDVIVTDDLSSVFDYSSIQNIQIQNPPCDCLGTSSASNNGVNGTADGVNPVKLDFTTLDKGSIPSPTLKCGYLEVDIK